MCGIYGKLSSHQIDASSVETATDRLLHAVPTSGRTALQLAQCKNDRELSAAKRVFDVSAAAAELVILAPLFAAFALVVRLVIDQPILFKQQRRRAFTIYKFRTMSNARNAEGRSLPDAERLGWFGKFLRSTRLDELPELINVLRDEMSIVGPRPLLTEYLPRYSAEQMHPLIPWQEMLAGLGECVENGQTISIDLSWPEKEQRSHYKKDCRRRLRKLREAGFVCVHDRENRYLREFVEVYHETMSRVQAEQSYFFDPTYFSDLAKSLGRALKLFVVKMPDGEVISGGLFTLCEGIVQYHLGGTPNTALKLSPIVLLLDTVRRGANENGAHTFHLGGGGGAKTDSLFQFKANFSRRRHEFVTWRWIVAPETYRERSRQKQLSNSERGLRAISPSFFPAYRCPSEPDAVPAALRAPAPAMAAPAEIQVAQNG